MSTKAFHLAKPIGSLKRICSIACTLFLVSIFFISFTGRWQLTGISKRFHHRPLHAEQILETCRNLRITPGPPSDFHRRTESDRYVPGTKQVVIRNATIWVGRGSGIEKNTDIILERGLIKKIGNVKKSEIKKDAITLDAKGAWVTPGLFDMHSHIGVFSVPLLDGATDGNSFKGVSQPWLRSLDGLNTHDESFRLSVAGGVTTSLILPGSVDAIGGQAFPIKLRSTSEKSPSSLLLEPPFVVNDTTVGGSLLPNRWRHMKHACGENPFWHYGYTRLDSQWSFRQSYNEARKILKKQDEYCQVAEAGLWDYLPNEFPESLQWEALVDVLRGKVKVNNHCYEAVDFDGMIRLTNEFKFSIVAFHHAHEAYLVPNLLKKMWGRPPAIALFAIHARYKRESYRGSEFAPRILADNNLQVVMKSDHPVLDSRFLIFEAQQAHYYGLDQDLALASVTTTPAELQGFGHRLGYVKEGYDADIVVWDSHPLILGATPQQVFIDGIPQLESPFLASKPEGFQQLHKMPNFDQEAADAIKYDGLPPLLQKKQVKSAIFTNVQTLYTKAKGLKAETLTVNNQHGVVVVENGRIICSGQPEHCPEFLHSPNYTERIDLQGGSIAPGLLTYGAQIGLVEMETEESANDGVAYAPIKQTVPSILGKGPLSHAIDGLQFLGRDTLLSYRYGITTAITAPTHSGLVGGLSVAFRPSAVNRLAKGAIVQNESALHVTVDQMSMQPSVSSQIAALRNLLSGHGEGDIGLYFKKASNGEIPLVVRTNNVDVIATLLELKKEVSSRGGNLKLTISGGAEAHILAKELAQADVGVILTRSRPFPLEWDSRRILPGIPLTAESAAIKLHRHNVTVGLGVISNSETRNARLEAGWIALNAGGQLSREEAITLVSSNLEKLLGLNPYEQPDMVAYSSGDVLDFHSKVVAVLSPELGYVDIL